MVVIVPLPISSYIHKNFSYRPDNSPLALLPPCVVRNRGAWPCRNTGLCSGNWGTGRARPWYPDPRVLVGVAACCVYQTAQGAGSGRPACAHLRQARIRHWHRPAHVPAGCTCAKSRANCKHGAFLRSAAVHRGPAAGWLVYAPEGHPSASSPAWPGCAGSLDANSKKCTFPLFPSIE